MRRPGIYGPYQHFKRWRLIIVGEGGRANYVAFDSREEAHAAKCEVEKQIAAQDGITVHVAIDTYETWQRARGLKPNSYETTRARLDKFMASISKMPLASITPARAKSIYEDWVTRAPVDTHRNMLMETKTFMRWAITKGWIKRSPFAAVVGLGKKRKGKPQLRYDEARRWYATAYTLAEAEPGALAAITTLAFGLRASEVAQLSVRDLDNGGHLLWVADSKTEAGRRTLEVPDDLHPLFQKMSTGKVATDPIFGPDRTRYWVYYWVQRICDLAHVQKVCAHAMRGLHGSTAVDAGATPRLVSAALGHASVGVTERHYLAPGTMGRATQRAALGVLQGGER